jgi:hypothetical protein
MRPARLLTGLSSMALVALLPDCASACSCMWLPGSQQEHARRALAQSSAVFSGEVIDVEKGYRSSSVIFRVSEVWKGKQRDTRTMKSSMGKRMGDSCAYGFEEGQEYLVYAYWGNVGSPPRPALTADGCTETKPLSEASADLEALGNGETMGGSGVLSDTSGGIPPLGIIGMLGGAVAAVSLVVLMRVVRTS